MNIIDLAVILFLGLGGLIGWYHGSVRSAANALAVLLAMVVALGFHGSLARSVAEQGKVIPQLLYYSESDEFIKDVDTSRVAVEGISAQELNTLLAQVSLPYPVEQGFRLNVANNAFAQQDATTLGEVLAMTIAQLTVNIGCFVLIFAVALVLALVVVAGLDATLQFPVLRYGDGIAGAVGGVITAVLLLYAVETLVPVGLSYVPFEEIRSIVDHAGTSAVFYQSNFILGRMAGIIG